MTAKTTPTERKLLFAALQLAAKKPWPAITLDQIVKAAKVKPVDARKFYADAAAIPPSLVSRIDEETAEALGEPDLNDSPHDRLFEVMMTRFDVMQQQRAGLLSIAKAARTAPPLAAAILRRQWQSASAMLGLAAINPRPFEIAGLLMIYHHAFCVWQQDDSRDMSKTMARLDRSLRTAEKLVTLVSRKRH